MSVEPGFGGQKFNPVAIEKIRQCKKLVGNRDIVIEVDGGITEENVVDVRAAGVDAVVAGNTVFSAPDKAATIKRLQG